MKRRSSFLIGMIILTLALLACGESTPSTSTASTPQPTQAPTVKPTAVPQVVATHGTPQLGGAISDFIGKYGNDGSVNTGSAPNGQPETSINWTVGNNQDLLRADYYTATKQVFSVTYSPTNDLTNDQIKAYLLPFFPADASVNDQAPNTDTLIAYTSSQYPHMFLHLSGGTGYINIV